MFTHVMVVVVKPYHITDNSLLWVCFVGRGWKYKDSMKLSIWKGVRGITYEHGGLNFGGVKGLSFKS